MEKKKSSKGNYRKAGFIMTPFVLVGLLLAYFLSAPISALISIGVFGLGCAIILIIIGDKTNLK